MLHFSVNNLWLLFVGQAMLHFSVNNLWLLFVGQARLHFSVNNLWLLFAGQAVPHWSIYNLRLPGVGRSQTRVVVFGPRMHRHISVGARPGSAKADPHKSNVGYYWPRSGQAKAWPHKLNFVAFAGARPCCIFR
jgi:hypothetical protein